MPKGVYPRSYRPLEERLWDYIMPEPNSGCWIWMGSLTAGYGQFAVLGGCGWKPQRAHVIAYQIYVGHVPCGLELDHLCRVRACCNPDHLEPVTHKENMRRSPLVGRTVPLKTHCHAGHPIGLSSSGKRVCRTCLRDATRRYRTRKQEPTHAR